MTIRNTTLAMAFLGSTALFVIPSYAVEPDVDSPAGPEHPAPRSDRPDFELDDQTGAEISPEGKLVIIEPDVVSEAPWIVIPERDVPNPEMEDLSPTR